MSLLIRNFLHSSAHCPERGKDAVREVYPSAPLEKRDEDPAAEMARKRPGARRAGGHGLNPASTPV
jgi:hypothetical protein